ncbi:MAG TPA: outer membrane lipoprotein carrier protein LolA [Bryobacteraceae bacterium]|nr:outer membrane lipoprotein carrier protein LolA [Bryobacteraceae bacterium]
MRLLRLALLPALLVTASQAADPLQQTLAKMQDASAAFHGLTADFQRTVYTAVIEEKDESSGSIAVRRSGPASMEMLMVVKTPDPQQISFSGNTAQIYNPKTNICDVYEKIDKKYTSVLNQYMMLGFGSSPKDLVKLYKIAYLAAENAGGRAAAKIELTPLQPDTVTHLVSADLWIAGDTGLAIQQQLNYQGGNYTLAVYSKMRINPGIPDSALKMKLPGNVKMEPHR